MVNIFKIYLGWKLIRLCFKNRNKNYIRLGYKIQINIKYFLGISKPKNKVQYLRYIF